MMWIYHELRKSEIIMCGYIREALEEKDYAKVKYWSEKLVDLKIEKEKIKSSKD